MDKVLLLSPALSLSASVLPFPAAVTRWLPAVASQSASPTAVLLLQAPYVGLVLSAPDLPTPVLREFLLSSPEGKKKKLKKEQMKFFNQKAPFPKTLV